MSASESAGAQTSSTGFVFSPACLLHETPPDHPEKPDRLRALHRRLEEEGLLAKLVPVAPREASDDDLHLCHTRAYLAAVRRDLARRAPVLSTGDTHLSPQADTSARAAAGCAMAAVDAVVSGRVRNAFAAVRPPGHHATLSRGMGFCLYNNVAIAARHARRAWGVERILIVDWDVHHGNGTQDIFYRRGDVLFASIHGDPLDAYPYFAGFADETGEGEGEGANLNCVLGPGTGYGPWAEALDHCIARIRDFGAEALVVSLGVDAYKDDPISFFRLDSPDFLDAGRRIGRIGLPTVLVMEGGYAIEQIGVNTVNVLEGFADA